MGRGPGWNRPDCGEDMVVTTRCRVCDRQLEADDENTCSSCRARCADCGRLLDRHVPTCPRAVRARMEMIDSRRRRQDDAWRQLQIELIRAHDAATAGYDELAEHHLKNATRIEPLVFGAL